MKKLWIYLYHEVYTFNDAEFIDTFNTRKALHDIALYKHPTMHLDEFLHTLDSVSMLHVLILQF